MKKSEMIDLLSQMTRLYRLENLNDRESAVKMLDFIERAGMRPPRLDDDKVQAIMSVYYGAYPTNQWDEDFETDAKVVEAYERRMERKRNK